MIILRYENPIKIFLIMIPIAFIASVIVLFLFASLLAVFTQEWIFSPDFWGSITGGSIVFGICIPVSVGFTMRGSKVSIPIEWNAQNFLEVLEKTLPYSGFELKRDGTVLLIYKKRPPIPVLIWEAKIEFDESIIKLEGPKSYVTEMKKVVEIVRETLKVKSGLAHPS